MTIKELTSILNSNSKNIPFFNGFAPAGTHVPFGVINHSTDNFFADNSAYKRFYKISVELYGYYDFEMLAAIDAVLDSNKIPWNRDEPAQINDENVFLFNYTMEV